MIGKDTESNTSNAEGGQLDAIVMRQTYTINRSIDGHPICEKNYILSKENIVRLLNEHENMSAQLNQLSDILVGYRDGDFFDIVTAATHFKMKSQNVELNNQFRQLSDAINELKDLSDDIMTDA